MSGDIGSEFAHTFIVLRLSDSGFELFVNGVSPLGRVSVSGEGLVPAVSDGVVNIDSFGLGVILIEEFFETFDRSKFFGVGFGGRSTSIIKFGLLFGGEEGLRSIGVISKDINIIFKLAF